MSKVLIAILYLLTILGLAYTDDLYQNNDERLLIPKSKLTKDVDNDILILHFNRIKDYRDKLAKTLEKTKLPFELLGPREFTRKKTVEEFHTFFNSHSELDIKLINNHGISYILKLEKEKRKENPLILKTLLREFPNIKMSGLPYLNYEIGLTTLDIKTKVLPALIVISLLIILFITKNFATTFSLFIFPLSSIPTALVLLKLIYGEANLLSNLAPLVNFVVIICLCLHLYYSSITFKNFTTMASHKMKPILFMLFTTIIGIFSLYISQVPSIKIFAMVTALALTLSAIFTLFGFKYFYSLILNEKSTSFDKIFTPPKLNSPVLLISLVLPLILFAIFKNNLYLQIEALYFFPKDKKIVVDTRSIEKNVIGTPILDIEIKNFNLAEQFEKAEIIDRLEQSIRGLFTEHTVIISPIQSIKNANYIYSNDKSIPKFKISALSLLAQTPKLEPQSENYQIKVLSKAIGTKKYFEITKKIRKLLEASNFKYEFFGNYYSLMNSQSEIISTLSKSFGLSLALISIIIGIYFRRVKDFIFFLLVNLLPPLMTLSCMAILGLTLNLATIMTFSVSFGLIVDSTIHVIHGKESKLTQEQMSESVYMPILVSSFMLMIGFISFVFHPFVPIWQFGLSLFITIGFGFIYDFFILPNLKFGSEA